MLQRDRSAAMIRFLVSTGLTGLLAIGCVPGSTGGGSGGSGGEPADDLGQPDAAPIEDAEIPDLARVDVGEGCEPGDELCNGLDDDCDGVVDNGFEGVGGGCTVGEGACAAEGTRVCSADGMALECDATPGLPGDELCNGVDDNCDGQVDEGFEFGQPCTAGEGACAVEGMTVCSADGAGVECGAAAGEIAVEICNGGDDDCDGAVDEDIAEEPCETGALGVCAAGSTVCVGGETMCQLVIRPGDEVCDGLDNDCDGEIDDVPGLGEACSVGEGQCAADGVTVCGDAGLVCDAEPGAPGEEVCDGEDNDCNGVVDDTPQVGRACAVGVGACAAAGTTVCTPEGIDCDAVPGRPVPEVCDGQDNDCNGLADDVPGLGDACTAGVGLCEARGTTICGPDGPTCDAVPGRPRPEVCDGADTDCNGVVDDAPGVGERCVVGVGECQAAGQLVCGEGETVCDARAGRPIPEVCDGLDNDCNGVVDDPPICFERENCANGIDDDGDRRVDCDDDECAAAPNCLPAPGLRDTVLLCGDSQRDMATLIEPADGLAFAAGCAPDDTTQAMLVSRSGVAQIDAPGWTGYVSRGGRIITEFSGSDDVYNALFGLGVVEGGQSGACTDNVNPAFRLNEGDGFWQANGALPLTAEGDTGCGRDMSAWPEIVPLGGHTPGAVHLAYRDLDAGRVYLVEGDWQDGGAPNGRLFTDATRDLLRYMILGPAGAPQQVGSFQVGDGPQWRGGEALALSCIEACARIFGGVAAQYGCSTVDGEYNGQAFVTGYADSDFCQGEGVAEDFVVPEEGADYNCGVNGCAYSAYVDDNCGDSTNYCWRVGGGVAPDPDPDPEANLMLCGTSRRAVADFAPPDTPLQLVDGCVPDARTRALLVTRDGAANLDGPAVQPWLEAGGVIITEYNVSDEVYNAVLGADVAQGGGNGGCSDQVNPPVRFNEDDPFWQANGALPLGDPNDAGCGFDVSAFPGITPLGGWSADTVSLAYIDVGVGRLWLVDIDWQDANGGFGDASLQLMQYMVGYTPAAIALGANQAYGHHGNCETFNDCGDGATCAGLACTRAGHGEALAWQEGLCSTLANGPVPDIVCSLFTSPEPANLDEGWGPSAGCDIPVVYDVRCAPVR